MENRFTWKLPLFIFAAGNEIIGRRLFEAATNLTSP